ncbi:hypothetical protein [Singulisphaera sp. PoT]|uniref:hypothetical protein n=1 Tax=Singulisphaera sp. PoT TaxID=3411797 RepID=UPI003BF580CC
MSDLDHLTHSGDPLEKAVIRLAGEALQSVLVPYSHIWAKYVLHARIGAGEFVDEFLLKFAASHYTALVRLYNALEFRHSIHNLCAESGPQEDGETLLKLQASTSAFWWSLGAAVDNLGKALEQFPGSTLRGRDAGIELLISSHVYISYIYGRRTQLIHSRVIPIGTDQGYPVSDTRYLDGKHRSTLPAETNWSLDYKSPSDLDASYEGLWNEAVQSLTSAWWAAKTFLDDVKKPQTSNKSLKEVKQISDYFGQLRGHVIQTDTSQSPGQSNYLQGPGPSGLYPGGGW